MRVLVGNLFLFAVVPIYSVSLQVVASVARMANRLLFLILIALPSISYAEKLLSVAACQRGGSKFIPFDISLLLRLLCSSAFYNCHMCNCNGQKHLCFFISFHGICDFPLARCLKKVAENAFTKNVIKFTYNESKQSL